MDVPFQAQIASIMDVLAKSAAAEIGKLLAAEDVAALRAQIRLRDRELEALLKRLRATQAELHRVKAARCLRSVAVQVETARDVLGYGGSLLSENQFCTDALPPFTPCKKKTCILETEEDLEFQMKIEQVEEAEEEKYDQGSTEHNYTNSEYRTDERSSQLWSSVTEAVNRGGQNIGESDYSSGCEQQRKYFLSQAEQCAAAHMLTEDGSCSFNDKANMALCTSKSGKGSGQGEGILGIKVTEQVQQTHKPLGAPNQKSCKATHMQQKAKEKRGPMSNVNTHSFTGTHVLAPLRTQHLSNIQEQLSGGFKIYRCGECGKHFTQRNRLVSHQWVHTGERPFRCHICGKMFSRQDNCQRHERLHSL